MNKSVIGKTVTIKLRVNGKPHSHTGVVLREDEVFKDTYLVGVTSSTLATKKPGAKYISIYRARGRDIGA